jgi:hypothetical protein
MEKGRWVMKQDGDQGNNNESILAERLYVLAGASAFGVFGFLLGVIAIGIVAHFYPTFGDAYISYPKWTGFVIIGAPWLIAFVIGWFWFKNQLRIKKRRREEKAQGFDE